MPFSSRIKFAYKRAGSYRRVHTGSLCEEKISSIRLAQNTVIQVSIVNKDKCINWSFLAALSTREMTWLKWSDGYLGYMPVGKASISALRSSSMVPSTPSVPGDR